MAIGVSYMGHDGRRADFTTEGNPTPGSALDQLVRGGTGGNPLTPLAEHMRRARRPQAPDPRTDKAAGTVRLSEADRRPGTLTEKMKRGGSVVASENGVCLKGEEQVAGNGVYAKNGEKQGFLTLDEIDDPNAKGGVVGEADSQNRLTPSNKTSSDKEGAFGVNMQSRTEAEVNEETGEVTFWEYTKRWDVTSGRRVGEVGGETKRKICSFFLGGGDRQITLTRPRSPFTVLRSHYTDANGNTQYEFWAKCLKWGNHLNFSQSSWREDLLNISNNRIPHRIGGTLDYYYFDGVYNIGDYGHYQKRPEGRPRKIVFDSGREVLVDYFEENDSVARFYDDCNCWTYIGGSEDGLILGEDCSDGNVSLYGSFCSYPVPFKTTYSQESISELEVRRGNYYDLTIWPDIFVKDAAHWNYDFINQYKMCITANQYKQHDLFEFLVTKGSVVASAYSNDDYDKNFWRRTYTCKGGVVLDVIRSPGFKEDYHYRYISNGEWETYCNDTADFPSLAHMLASKNPLGNYEDHDYSYYNRFGWRGLYGNDEIYNYPERKDRFVQYGYPDIVKSNILTSKRRLCDGLIIPSYETMSGCEHDKFFNVKLGRRTEYSGDWRDFFPFFIEENFYGFHYGANDHIDVNAKQSKIAEIRNWEIVENEVGNLYCYVKENAKGEILDVQLKKFGDVVRNGNEDVVIKDDLVIVEK